VPRVPSRVSRAAEGTATETATVCPVRRAASANTASSINRAYRCVVTIDECPRSC
jgi:hypothetical protein